MQAESTPTLPKRASSTAHRRGGRPSAEQAGDVDRRILGAATELFLRLGFEATSCDQVAVQAGAGKASIYARYANKDELFAAVVRQSVERSVARTVKLRVDLPLRERLREVGLTIMTDTFRPEVVALMRVVISTASRMPDLARHAEQIGRDQGVASVAAAVAGPRAVDQAVLERAQPIASKFIDLVFAPHQMRALLGDDLGDLHGRVEASIAEAIDLLGKGGWLDDWE